ncbi:hypothetical protein RJ639_040081 [Escallonia herrerae]|uniref:COBRA-like protein n=1 Tax=Escallonia herrerae TaxID=1293975 RepID=A0AA88WMI0_9ASTE|nr:hypothetical protein RJ639_040081 [Escallonia herrerae]
MRLGVIVRIYYFSGILLVLCCYFDFTSWRENSFLNNLLNLQIAMTHWIQMEISRLPLTYFDGQMMAMWKNHARVTIQNYYLYRHVDKPGWKLGWTWARNEVILSMSGAVATQQGNCSSFKVQKPHSCEKDPIIIDLPESMQQNRSEDCCRDGLLSAWSINPFKSFSSFEVTVGNVGGTSSVSKPSSLTLRSPGPGYTCGLIVDTDPTVSSVIGGRREEQVYNCMCMWNREDSLSQSDPDLVHCTDHMCPLSVHWHVKNNYKTHWRVKLTISNYNYGKNYTDWNVLVQHPAFSQPATTYSFNSTVLPTVGTSDDAALFWGLEYYNDALLQADEKQLGSVTTEILMRKDEDSFTLRNGWGFPRRIYVNGENCEMPLPDDYPRLPNGSSSKEPSSHHFLLFLVHLTFITLVVWF